MPVAGTCTTDSGSAGASDDYCPLALEEGWDPIAPDDGRRSPLHHGARKTNPMVVSPLVGLFSHRSTPRLAY